MKIIIPAVTITAVFGFTAIETVQAVTLNTVDVHVFHDGIAGNPSNPPDGVTDVRLSPDSFSGVINAITLNVYDSSHTTLLYSNTIDYCSSPSGGCTNGLNHYDANLNTTYCYDFTAHQDSPPSDSTISFCLFLASNDYVQYVTLTSYTDHVDVSWWYSPESYTLGYSVANVWREKYGHIMTQVLFNSTDMSYSDYDVEYPNGNHYLISSYIDSPPAGTVVHYDVLTAYVTTACDPDLHTNFDASPASSDWGYSANVTLDAYDNCGDPYSGSVNYEITRPSYTWEAGNDFMPITRTINADGIYSISMDANGFSGAFGTYKIDRTPPTGTISVLNPSIPPTAPGNSQTITVVAQDATVNNTYSGIDKIRISSVIPDNYYFVWHEVGHDGESTSFYNQVDCTPALTGILYIKNKITPDKVSNVSCTTAGTNNNKTVNVSFTVDSDIQVDASDNSCFNTRVHDWVNYADYTNDCFQITYCNPDDNTTFTATPNQSDWAYQVDVNVTAVNDCGNPYGGLVNYEVQRQSTTWKSGNFTQPGSVAIDEDGVHTLVLRDSLASPHATSFSVYNIDRTVPTIDSITNTNTLVTLDSADNNQVISINTTDPVINGASSGIDTLKINSDIVGNFNFIWHARAAETESSSTHTPVTCTGGGTLYILNNDTDKISNIACSVLAINAGAGRNLQISFNANNDISYNASRRVDYTVISEDIVPNISPSSASGFEINHKPLVEIVSPLDGSLYIDGDNAVFEGDLLNENGSTGNDQDGDVIVYQWNPSCVGTGTGINNGSFTDDNSISNQSISITQAMVPSVCTLTLTATDEHGATDTSDPVTITLRQRPYISAFSYSPNLDPQTEFFGSTGDYTFTIDYTYPDPPPTGEMTTLSFALDSVVPYPYASGNNDYMILIYRAEHNTFYAFDNTASPQLVSLCINTSCTGSFTTDGNNEWVLKHAEASQIGADTIRLEYTIHFESENWNEAVQAFAHVATRSQKPDGTFIESVIEEFDTPNMDTLAPTLVSNQLSETIVGSTCENENYYIHPDDPIGYTRGGGKIVYSALMQENGESHTLRSISLKLVNNSNADDFYTYKYNVDEGTGVFEQGSNTRLTINAPGGVNPVTITGDDHEVLFCVNGVSSTDSETYSIFVTAEDTTGNGTTHAGNPLTQ